MLILLLQFLVLHIDPIIVLLINIIDFLELVSFVGLLDNSTIGTNGLLAVEAVVLEF